LQLGLLYANGQGVAQDHVQSHMWLSVAANSSSFFKQARDQALRNREIVAAKMTSAQLAQAQALASQCQQQEFRQCGSLPPDAETMAQAINASPNNSAQQLAGSPAQKIILLENDSGTYGVRVVVNGVISLKFVLDSGASDVSIPSDVLATLMRSGTVQDSDFQGTRTYVLADGSKLPARTLRIRSLKVGDVIMENVLASIAPPNGGLLLGQSFLSRLKSWSIDNSAHALIIN
jgi:clan AA aspartic protease (TIGR02281 family)